MANVDFEGIVDRYYKALFRFAYSLANCEATASDLTQQTFYIWASKGHQLRDPGKVKSWLFTTLYRQFLSQNRREKAHPHYAPEIVEAELPTVSSDAVRQASIEEVLEAMQRLDDVYRVPLALFHIESHSYKEIAEMLSIPIGTVMSRLSRAREHLLRMLSDSDEAPSSEKVVPISRGRKTR